MIRTKDIITKGRVVKTFYNEQNFKGEEVLVCVKEYQGKLYYLQLANNKCLKRQEVVNCAQS